MTPVTATAGSVMPDFEAAERGRVWQRHFRMILNMSAQLALPNGFHESADFVVFARGQELDAAIVQIPHRSGDIESLRELPYGIAETNALDIAFVENLEGGDHVTGKLIRHSADGNC